MKRLLTLLLLLSVGFRVCAQRETDNWYFGSQASLEFNQNGVPVSFANSAMTTNGGSASISDEFGNLLFYTDGQTVWNQLHLPMANGNGLSGNGLYGNPSATQSVLIVQKPGSNTDYYIFTTNYAISSNTGIRYSEIDMTAFNGLGEVKTTAKNILLHGTTSAPIPVSEKLAAVYASNNRDIWVITHYYAALIGRHQFLAYKISSAGVSQQPVISDFPGPDWGRAGHLKASPDGKYVAASFQGENNTLYSFDNKTGFLSNPILLETRGAQPESFYGLEFSPDGLKLYTASTANGTIRQFNLANPAPASIIASRTIIGTNTSLNANGALQLARNGKIYIAQNGNTQLGVINNPNALGLACNYQQGPTLAQLTSSKLGLPNFMASYFAAPRFTAAGICAENPFVFTITNQTGIDSVKWNFGDPLSGVTNTSGSRQPSHIYHMSGFYKVTLTVFMAGEASYFSRQIDVKNAPLVSLGPDTIVCEGTALTLSNAYPNSAFNETYLWDNNSAGKSITVNTSGYYWLELSNGICTTRDSVKVTFVPGPTVKLGSDTIVCGTSAVTIKPTTIDSAATYLWQPGGQTTPSIQVTKTGLYQVTVMKNGCQATDIRNVKFIPGLAVNLGPDKEVCEGEEVILKGPSLTPAPVYLWSDSSSGKTLRALKAGKYWLRVTRNGCSVTDTVSVNFKNCPPPIIPYIPNMITPNADGKNDKLVIGNLPEGVFWSLKLYNRWGQLVLNDPHYQHNWPQKDLMDGHYYYLLVEPETNRTWKGWLEVVH